MAKVVWINERGGLTLPKEIRDQIPCLDGVRVSYEKGKIILDPLMTSDEFLQELELRAKEAEEGKTYTLEEMDEIMEKHYEKQEKLSNKIQQKSKKRPSES
jgi:bifunctional DNA-binding transcriptional regulator/antitoxin component of YhaV-PrlF toxin-antitoxin module